MPRKHQISPEIQRLIEFGQERVGKAYGWKKRFADILGMSPQQLHDLLSAKSPIGAKIRERLHAAGCDIEWLTTGKKSGGHPPTLHIAEPVAIYAMGELSKEKEEALRKLNKLAEKLGADNVELLERLGRELLKKTK